MLSALLVATLVAMSGFRAAAAQPSAERLGDAYRAYEAGDYQRAYALAIAIDRERLANPDYALYIAAQAAFLTGDFARARALFAELRGYSSSRFHAVAAWRHADCQWQLGNHQAARKAYAALLKGSNAELGDAVLARFRIAEAELERDRKSAARQALTGLLIDHSSHPVAARARRHLRKLSGRAGANLSAKQRIEKARQLTGAHLWHQAITTLRTIADDQPVAIRRARDFWMGMTLFKMRRRYEDAGRLLLAVYPHMGVNAATSLFHGARALSRADHDEEAIKWYLRLVNEYPSSIWAAEAQFLSGWLDFNMGNYRAAIPRFAKLLRRFKGSKWVTHTRWFMGFSHYLLGEHSAALPWFERLAQHKRRLEGGKGDYWRARTLDQLGRSDEARAGYRDVVARFPFSWYALLGRARLGEHGESIGVFGGAAVNATGSAIAEKVDEKLARDPLVRAADELLAAGLIVAAGFELRRGERAFLKRHDRGPALAMLCDRYRRGANFNRPWYLGIVYGRAALAAPPRGPARIWWQHAYPLAYDDLVEKHRPLGGSPRYYLTSIMRKESGFDPHVVSYADAYGLLQMIPPTTKRVTAALNIDYTRDLLFDPELNIKTGSWYIGRLFAKFKGQVPISSGSYNSGPKPWIRWLDQNGDRPMDEFIELVSYRQTREYAKKVTETYARYLYLYEGEIYEQPLLVDRDYVDDDLTY